MTQSNKQDILERKRANGNESFSSAILAFTHNSFPAYITKSECKYRGAKIQQFRCVGCTSHTVRVVIFIETVIEISQLYTLFKTSRNDKSTENYYLAQDKSPNLYSFSGFGRSPHLQLNEGHPLIGITYGAENYLLKLGSRDSQLQRANSGYARCS